MFQILLNKGPRSSFIKFRSVWQNDSALCFLRNKISTVKSNHLGNGWVFLPKDDSTTCFTQERQGQSQGRLPLARERGGRARGLALPGGERGESAAVILMCPCSYSFKTGLIWTVYYLKCSKSVVLQNIHTEVFPPQRWRKWQTNKGL